MKKINLVFIGIVILIALIISAFVFEKIDFFKYQDKNPKVCFGKNCFFVEIALTEEEKKKGLMFRGFLEENNGMLFVYDMEGIYSFWMKNTLISLDIIWINDERRVVYIKHKAQPCGEVCVSINPSKNARFILEVKGGTAERLNIDSGDKVNFYNLNRSLI